MAFDMRTCRFIDYNRLTCGCMVDGLISDDLGFGSLCGDLFVNSAVF